jgi:hypothetical protein
VGRLAQELLQLGVREELHAQATHGGHELSQLHQVRRVDVVGDDLGQLIQLPGVQLEQPRDGVAVEHVRDGICVMEFSAARKMPVLSTCMA